MHNFHWIFKRLLSSKGLRCQTFAGTQDQAPLCASVHCRGFTKSATEAWRGDGWEEAGHGSGKTAGDRSWWRPSEAPLDSLLQPGLPEGLWESQGRRHRKTSEIGTTSTPKLLTQVTRTAWNQSVTVMHCGFPPSHLSPRHAMKAVVQQGAWTQQRTRGCSWAFSLWMEPGSFHFCCDNPSTALTHVSVPVSWRRQESVSRLECRGGKAPCSPLPGRGTSHSSGGLWNIPPVLSWTASLWLQRQHDGPCPQVILQLFLM